jgi:hypothetical protein
MKSGLRPLIVLVAALGLLAVIAVATAGITTSDQSNPSSRSAGRLGTLAAYTWLGDLGLPVHRVSGAFDLRGTDVLVVYDPTVVLSPGDVQAVMALLDRGGDAIVVCDLSSAANVQALFGAVGVQIDRPVAAADAVPAQPYDPTDRVHAVPLSAGFSFAPLPPAVPLLRAGGDVVASAVRVHHAGRVYLLGDTAPLSNDGLRRGDSAFFVLSLLERARAGRVGFDEYHHGEGAQAGEGAAAIFNGPMGVAAVLVAVIVITAVALNGRRLGRPVAAGAAAGIPSAATYVTAMGRLFARSRQRGAIAARYADELKRRGGELSGVDGRLDDPDFVSALRAVHPERALELERLLFDLRRLQESAPDEAALLRAAREVDGLERAWSGAEWRP